MASNFDSLPDAAKRAAFAKMKPGQGKQPVDNDSDIDSKMERIIRRWAKKGNPLHKGEIRAIRQDLERRQNLRDFEKIQHEVLEEYRKEMDHKESQKRLREPIPDLATSDPLLELMAKLDRLFGLRARARDSIEGKLHEIAGYGTGSPRDQPRAGYWIGETLAQREQRMLRQSQWRLPDPSDPLLRYLSRPPEDHMYLEPPGPDMTHPFLGPLWVESRHIDRSMLDNLPSWARSAIRDKAELDIKLEMDWRHPLQSIEDHFGIRLERLKRDLDQLRKKF